MDRTRAPPHSQCTLHSSLAGSSLERGVSPPYPNQLSADVIHKAGGKAGHIDCLQSIPRSRCETTIILIDDKQINFSGGPRLSKLMRLFDLALL